MLLFCGLMDHGSSQQGTTVLGTMEWIPLSPCSSSSSFPFLFLVHFAEQWMFDTFILDAGESTRIKETNGLFLSPLTARLHPSRFFCLRPRPSSQKKSSSSLVMVAGPILQKYISVFIF